MPPSSHSWEPPAIPGRFSPQYAFERALLALAKDGVTEHASQRTLAQLERLWCEVGSSHPSVAVIGFQTAERARDVGAIARWGHRVTRMSQDDPWRIYSVARAYVQYAPLRAEGMLLLSGLADTTDVVEDTSRPLWQAVGERQQDVDDLRSWAYQRLGEALLAMGNRQSALDVLRLAALRGWNLERFRAIASVALSAGDTSEAARMLALVCLDPETSPAFADTARVMLGAGMPDARWRATLATAQDAMRERLLAMSSREPLRANAIRLVTPTGLQRSFADASAGRVTVVAFGLQLRGTSLVRPDVMQRMATRLSAQGMQLIVLAHEQRTGDVSDVMRRRGINFAVYFDEYRDAERAFKAYGFPMYFVVDRAGMVRFAYSDVSQVLAQASLLAQESQVARAH